MSLAHGGTLKAMSSNILDCVAPRKSWLFGVSLLLGAVACVAANAAGVKEDFAFVFQCEEKTRAVCLVGTFPSDKKITLVSADGRQCSATTRDSFGYPYVSDDIPATRLDTTRCQGPSYVLAWLSPEKGTVQVIKPQEVEDKARLSEIEKGVSRTGLLRFNERKWREENPEPLNDERLLQQLAAVKTFYTDITGPLRAYRLAASEEEVLLLRYRMKFDRNQGPILLRLGGAIQLLEYRASSPVAFAIGNRMYLMLRWGKGEGGYIGSSIWEIGEKRAREVLSDDSFST